MAKFKCTYPGCDKSFPKSHGLGVHISRMHTPIAAALPANGEAYEITTANGTFPDFGGTVIAKVRAVRAMATEMGGYDNLRNLIEALDS